jgi:ankyrin repeat protein
MSPLYDAVQAKDVEAVEKILDENPALLHLPIFDDDLPLHFAAWQKNLSMVQLLLSRGAAVNARGDLGKRPLHYAVYEGDEASTPIVQALIDAGADANAKDDLLEQNALGWAVREAHEGLAAAIDLLHAAGATIDLEAAMIRDDYARATALLASDDPGMSLNRIRAIRVEADSPIWSSSRERFVELIDHWLASRSA